MPKRSYGNEVVEVARRRNSADGGRTETRAEARPRSEEKRRAGAQAREPRMRGDAGPTRAYKLREDRIRRGQGEGQEAQAGVPVLRIVPLEPKYLWLNAYFDEKEVANLQPGQECSIKFTALPELDLKGHILSIRAATAALPLQDDDFFANFKNSKNMVPVKISIDNYDADIMPQIRLGMTALVKPL